MLEVPDEAEAGAVLVEGGHGGLDITCHVSNTATCLVTWDSGTVRWSTEMGADTTNLVRWQRPPVARMSRTHCEGEQNEIRVNWEYCCG